MAFQDNSGDIIFDVVLTDEGRRRLAGSTFSITQFSLGDDEINYQLYDASLSSFNADLQILQTPVLEAFTNNMSSMKSKLVTYPRNDLLHLTVLKLNELGAFNKMHSTIGAFVVAVDGLTEDNNGSRNPTTAIGVGTDGLVVNGVLFGEDIRGSQNSIRVDSGLDTQSISPNQLGQYPEELKETQYLIEMDNRLGHLVSTDGTFRPSPDYVDDDGYASYTVSIASSALFVKENQETGNAVATEVIQGPRGTLLEFKIASSLSLRQSTYLFNLLGSDGTMINAAGSTSQAVKLIDSIIKITGMTTGYSINIPVRYVKVV